MCVYEIISCLAIQACGLSCWCSGEEGACLCVPVGVTVPCTRGHPRARSLWTLCYGRTLAPPICEFLIDQRSRASPYWLVLCCHCAVSLATLMEPLTQTPPVACCHRRAPSAQPPLAADTRLLVNSRPLLDVRVNMQARSMQNNCKVAHANTRTSTLGYSILVRVMVSTNRVRPRHGVRLDSHVRRRPKAYSTPPQKSKQANTVIRGHAVSTPSPECTAQTATHQEQTHSTPASFLRCKVSMF
jgi:hypothetical protein